MTCPYRGYNYSLKRWICTIAIQDCPEATLDGFQFEECSTYREHEKILNETNNAKKDVEDTINFMLEALKRHYATPEFIYLPYSYTKKDEKKIKKYIKFLKKDLAKGFGMKRKELFGKEVKK